MKPDPFSCLVLRTLSNGRQVRLTSGRNGLRHILERHVPLYYGGTNRGQGRDTLFPGHTTALDIIDIADEAAKGLPDNAMANALYSVRLRNGESVDVFLDENLNIVQLYPSTVDNSFGYALSDIERFVR